MSPKTISIIAATALLLSLSLPGAALAQDEPGELMRTAVVAGTGQASAEPDEAIVRFGVSARAQDARTAMRRAARSMDAVITALEDTGIAEDDIKTVRLDLHQYRQRNEAREVVASGWQVDQQVRATVRDIEATSAVIDAAVEAGATDIGNIRFGASDPSAAVAAARVAAVESAATAATTLAAASGLEVLGVISMVEGGATVPFTRSFGDTAAQSAYVATPIEPGLVDISVTVTVEYEIG